MTKARELAKLIRAALKDAGHNHAHYNAGGWQKNIDGYLNPGYGVKPRRAGVVTVVFIDSRVQPFEKRPLVSRIEDGKQHRAIIKKYAQALEALVKVETVDEGLGERPYLRCTEKDHNHVTSD